MKKFWKIFICAAMLFSFASANVSAAPAVEMSSDNIRDFMFKVNQELKKNDPNNSLDTPAEKEKFFYYEDVVQLDESLSVKFVYVTKNDKMYFIRVKPSKLDDNAKTFLEGMTIVYFKAMGVSEETAKKLSKFGEGDEWQNEEIVSELNKKFAVKFKNSEIIIKAADSQK